MKRVNIGLVGSGFAASIHADSYGKIYGLDVRIKAVASIDVNRNEFAKKHCIPVVKTDYRELISDPEIDIIDIATPVNQHMPMIMQSLEAGKHVICEKPLTGYCGLPGDVDPIGRTVSRQVMYEYICENIRKLREKVRASGRLFMYAENFVYAPSVQRSVDILKSRKAHAMMIRAEEWHSGSHAYHAGRWECTGGGVLIRMACHPLTAALYIKHETSINRGQDVAISKVWAQTANMIERLEEKDLVHISARPYDVEDWAKIVVTFSDGTVADISCSDFALGGTRNVVETYANNCVLTANMSPNTENMGYFPDEEGMEKVYIAEKVENKSGYQYIYSNEEITRGYIGELQDFTECAAYGREPVCGMDLASETIQAIYAGYLSAEKGSQIIF
jgi:predicted dehydrogenase